MRFGTPLPLAFAGVVLGLAAGFAFLSFQSTGPTDPWSSPAPSLADAPERFEEILGERDSSRRAGRVASLFQVLTPGSKKVSEEELASIRQVFESSNLNDGDLEFALFASWWARADPEGAFQWTRTAPQGGATSVHVAVFDEWGRQDPASALRAALTERTPAQRRAALASTLLGADAAGRADASLWALVASISDDSLRRAALQPLFDRRLTMGGVDEVVLWSDRMEAPDAGIARDLRAAAAVAVSKRDPGRAAQILSSLSEGGTAAPVPRETIESVATRWVALEPEAALEWLGSLPPSADRPEILQATFQIWVGRDRGAALAWASNRAADGPGVWFDPIRALYGLILGHKEPEAGLRLLFELPIGEERAQKVQAVFVNWKAVAPEAAEAWLEKADLPEFRKQDLRRAPLPSRPVRLRAAAPAAAAGETQ